MLRIAVLSSASGGGAGIAARRVTDALNMDDGIRADFIDRNALSCRLPDDAAPQRNMSNRRVTNTHFTVEYPGYVRGWLIDLLKTYDVINVHWSSYLIGLAELDELSRSGMPMLFTLHDYYYITGGCHYPAGCGRYISACMPCPQVDHNDCSKHVIAENLQWKRRIFARPNVHLAAPSRFLVNEALKSGIVPESRTHVLRNPYVPEKGIEPTYNAGIPRIVLIADSLAESRKGMQLAVDSLAEAYRRLFEEGARETPFIVDIIGNVDPLLQGVLERSGLAFVLHGKITVHQDLAKLIASCECLLTCSFEDNWPNVLVEAGAYGVIPVVGPGHGCEEFVREFGTGEVASEYTAAAFAEAVISAMYRRRLGQIDIFLQSVIRAHAPEQVGRRYRQAINAVLQRANSGMSEEIKELTAKMRKHYSDHLICNSDTELIVEGFPRSSNTYFVDFIQYLSKKGRNINLAHHTHSIDNLLLGMLYKKPCLVLIREPVEAITSFVVYSQNEIPDVAKQYLEFYLKILNLKGEILIADFRTIVNDINKVIDRLNKEFLLQIPKSLNAAEDSLIVSEIDRERALARRAEDEYIRTVGAPNDKRDQIKEVVRPKVSQYLSKEEKILNLYNQITHFDNYI